MGRSLGAGFGLVSVKSLSMIIDVLETFFCFNILFFTIFTWFSLDDKHSHKEAIAYTSVTITIIVLLLIVLCHVYTHIHQHLLKSQEGKAWWNRLTMNPLRRTIQHTTNIIAVSATVGSLETLAAATRYKATRAISSNPVQ